MNAIRYKSPRNQSEPRLSVRLIENALQAEAKARVAIAQPGETIFTIEVQGIKAGFCALGVRNILEGFWEIRVPTCTYIQLDDDFGVSVMESL